MKKICKNIRRPQWECRTFALGNEKEKDPLQSPCLGGWYQLKESWFPAFPRAL